MNEYITVVVPSCPSGFKPYPELIIEATVQDFRIIATCLRALEKSSEPICSRLGAMVQHGYENELHDRPEANEPIHQAIAKALVPYWYITSYCLRGCDWRALHYTTLRSTWVDHIERSIWEQIGH